MRAQEKWKKVNTRARGFGSFFPVPLELNLTPPPPPYDVLKRSTPGRTANPTGRGFRQYLRYYSLILLVCEELVCTDIFGVCKSM